MDCIIQETIQYTRNRKIFKQPVLHHQAVHFRLAELQTEVELLRSLLYRAIGKKSLDVDEKENYTAPEGLCSLFVLPKFVQSIETHRINTLRELCKWDFHRL